MNKKLAYSEGFNTGYEIADTNISELTAVYSQEDLDKFVDSMASFESDEYRQYSPFEFFAHDINACHNADSLWEAYNNGVYRGIQKRVKKFKRDNKKGYQG